MRLSTKLTAAVGATSLAVLGAYATYSVRQEHEDLSNAIEREVRLLGSAMQVAVQNAIRDGQIDDVREILDSMEKVEPTLDVFLFEEGGALTASSEGSEPNLSLARVLLAQSATPSQPLFKIEDGPRFTRAFLALRLKDATGASRGALVLIKALDDAQADMVRTRLSIVLSVVGLIAAISGVAWTLGVFQIKRPLAAMIASMRALRSGEYQLNVPRRAEDEIGEAITEFNALVADLRDTRTRLSAEEEARREIEEGLLRVDKLITVGQLAAGLAHEIGSPLQILNGRARALLQTAESPQEVRRHADILVAQTERVARIVEQLLRFSRRVSPQMSPCALVSVVESVVELVEYSARRKGIRVELTSVGEPLTLVADRDRLQQVVLNLLNNALRATPAGGSIRVILSACPADASTAGEPPWARIVVEDTGCGMSEEVLAHAFEPFFTTASESGGTGLGLATARMIVLEHGGRIGVESKPGAGCRFTIELPRAAPGSPAQKEVAS